MKIILIVLLIVSVTIYACGHGRIFTTNAVAVNVETAKPQNDANNQDHQTQNNNKYIHTTNEYTDAIGNKLTIQNSLPKGGLKYIEPNGTDFVYAIFWNRITNESENSLELTINFPADSIALPSSPDTYFNLLIPSDTMTHDKEPMFNYGLTGLESFLDSALHKPSSLKRKVNPGDSCAFYIVTLFNKGVNGTVRTELSKKEQTLFYKINEKEIQCGQINFSNTK